MSDQMTAEWTTFTKTGDPTVPDTPLWLPFRVGGGTVMSLQPSGDSELTSSAELSQQLRPRLAERLTTPHPAPEL